MLKYILQEVIKNMEDKNEKILDDHEERIRKLEINAVRSDLLAENCTKALDKLDSTMSKVMETMNDMSFNMIKMQDGINVMGNSIKESDNSIKSLTEKVEKIEEKTKLDWQEWITKNWWKIMGALILLSASFPSFKEAILSLFN